MTRATMNTFTLPSSAATDTSSATSCVTSCVTSCAASLTGSSLMCSSFTCHLRGGLAWVLSLTDDNPSSAAPSTSSATSCITSSATSFAASFLHVLVPHVLVLHVSPKNKRGVGSAAGRWLLAR